MPRSAISIRSRTKSRPTFIRCRNPAWRNAAAFARGVRTLVVDLDPQSDEEGTDIYPVPKSGMAERGRQIYAANGCMYCHSQQVRADYAASDIERKWGVRRSAPRDYIFERPVLHPSSTVGYGAGHAGI